MSSTFQQYQSYKDPLLIEMAEVGERLTIDILRELTRKRQNYLLVWSFVTVLISLSIIQPTEGTIVGFKFPVTNVNLLNTVLGAICLYLTFIYCLSVLFDYRANGYKQVQIATTIDRIASLLAKWGDDHRKRDQKKMEDLVSGKVVSDVGNAFTQMQTQLEEEFKPKFDDIETQIRNAQSTVDRKVLEHQRHLLASEKWHEWKRRNAILEQKFDREIEENRKEGELEAEYSKYVLHHEKNLVHTLKAYLRLYWLNFIVEVVFPVGLGILASILCFGFIG